MSFLTSLRPSMPRLASSASGAAASGSSTRLFSSSRASRVARITVVGRLAAAPELVTTPSGAELVRYAVATSHGSGENQTTSWWKVAAFTPEGPGRDRLISLGKGSLVYVEGEASMRKFERDGKQEQALSIVQSTRFPITRSVGLKTVLMNVADKLDVLKRNDASASNDSIVEED